MIQAKTLHGWLARGLIAICALNVNGIFRMAVGTEEVASIAMLGLSLVLIVTCGQKVRSLAFISFCATVLTYIGIGFASY